MPGPAAKSIDPRCYGGSYVCDSHILRITARCCAEDLGAAGVPFSRLLKQPIVKPFVRERSDKTVGDRQVTPLTGKREVWVLAHGHDHRGATWHDEAEGFVWLCACARHRSGQDDDAFNVFKQLERDGQLFPTASGYELALRERNDKIAADLIHEVNAIPAVGARLIDEARANPGDEIRGTLGGTLGVGVVVQYLDDISELLVIFQANALARFDLPVLLQAFALGSTLDDWSMLEELPHREMRADELVMSYLDGR